MSSDRWWGTMRGLSTSCHKPSWDPAYLGFLEYAATDPRTTTGTKERLG